MAAPGEHQPLEIQIYDYSNIRTGGLDHFVSGLREILASAGVLAEFRLCRGNGPISDNCARELSVPLILRIIPGRGPASKNGERLGDSYASGGNLASVYAGTAEDQAKAARVPCMVVLVFTAAHEVGHLLLGARAHTSRGIMKAEWDRTDFIAMYENRLRFAPEQVHALAERSGIRTTASTR